MRRELITLVAVFGSLGVLTTAMSAYAKDPAEEEAIKAGQKGAAETKATAVVPFVAPANQQTAVMCQTCFTCGGDWPIFAGSTHAVNTGNLTFERGGSCQGSLAGSNDTYPFLCCR